MVVNDKYRFVFIHVPKAAGTSMAGLLREVEGNNRCWVAHDTKHETLREFGENLSRRRTFADVLRGRVLSRYFIFGFVRNPWDRVSSLYRYLKEIRPRPEIATIGSFEEFLERAVAGEEWILGLHSMRPQIDFFRTLDGRIRADFIGHLEHVEEDFSRVLEQLGVRGLQLPHANRSSNFRCDYRDAYTSRMVDLVEELFAPDIDQFGYSYEQTEPLRRCSGSLDNCVNHSRLTNRLRSV